MYVMLYTKLQNLRLSFTRIMSSARVVTVAQGILRYVVVTLFFV